MVQAISEDFSAHNLFGAQRGLIPKFYIERVEKRQHDDAGNVVQTIDEKSGAAVYNTVECIEIAIAGDPTLTVKRRVRPSDRERFAREYKLWKEGQEYAVEGTPLSELPGITQSQIQLYGAWNVTSIEQLAGLDDGKIANLGIGARPMVMRARKWLADREGAADDIQAASRLANLEAELEALRKASDQRESELKATKMALAAIRGSDDDDADEDEDRSAAKTRGRRGGRKKAAKGGGIEASNPNAVREGDFTVPAKGAEPDEPNPFADGDGEWDPAAEIMKAAAE